MSNYKYPTPQLLLKAICDAIRAKTGSNNKIIHQNIPDELDNIMTEEEYEIAVQELSDIIYGSEMKILDSKYILNIANYKFYNNNNLTTINLPKCTFIGDWAFSDCTSLITANLPKCTFVEDVAFRNCTNLTTINLPECIYVSSIAFGSCTNLTTIILSNNQVATLENISAFNNSSIVNGTGYIYVPDNLVDSYKTDTNWSNYANQIKPLSELLSELKEEYGYD